MKKIKLVEIARSFSYKKVKNLGNYESETVDFFCSQKAEVLEKDAEKTSEVLYQFCKNECVKSLNSYLKEKEKPNEVEYAKGFSAGYKKAVDPNEGREVAAEMTMDMKSENTLDPY